MGKRSGFIGLDLGGGTLRAVQFAGGPRGRRPIARAALERTDTSAPLTAEELTEFKAVLERSGFKGREVVIAAPPTDVVRSMLELPPAASGAPVQQMALDDMARTLELDPSSVELALWELPPCDRDGQTARALASVYAHAQADATIDLVQQAGLEIAAIDVECWSIARACEPALDPDGATAVVDVGWTCASLCVLWRGVIIYERAIEEGGLAKLSAALAEALHTESPADALCTVARARSLDRIDPSVRDTIREILDRTCEVIGEDVRAALKFAEHRYGWGGGSRLAVSGELPGLASRIGRGVGMEAQPITNANLFDGLDENDPDAHQPTSFARAVGLALWEVPG